MKERIVLIGAGSAVFTRGLVADLITRGVETELVLVDSDPEALAAAEKLTAKMIASRQAPIQLSASVDRRTVLAGATVVICTIGVGGRRAWEQDVFIPRKYGIIVPVGDTVGPGGSSRALRMIPAMIAIAQDVLDLAPEALFFNYGNPMAPVCRAIHKATGAKVIGLCHGVNAVAAYLSRALRVPQADLHYTAVGINHLTWFTALRVNGQDALPRLHEIAAERLLDPYEGEPFSWRLFELFHAFPAVLDRHVTEFFPQFFREGAYYGGKTLGNEAFSFEDTIAGGDETFEQMRTDALAAEPLPTDYFERIGGEHEQVLEIVEAIRTERGTIFSANLPNTGQVPNLPREVIVESPAVADGSGLHALALPALPAALVGTLATRYMWAETIVEAALEGSRTKFIQALVLDGSVKSLEMASSVADELLEAQAAYLPWVKREGL
ncbi:family 4 glycosyl hydrolase [Tengunoibacter tsumagoiensis]|uniref:Alpha-glucosidase/alpha-galactosidase n=1 Tax=Tengunoibacter tsumagoiensis TaxID=2014871 RepID=A0A402A3X2_9CHLR|nr:hypothetical protein [Tengunoibacter tsumagoiensis]GCE13858.1 alpha-glucosidase/alpha-galactosidase [Tengunoibacter tsumagoiensis]